MPTFNSSTFPVERQQPNYHPQNIPATFLREQILSFRNTQLLAVAAKLNLATLLKDGAKSAQQLSIMVRTNERAIYRLLRALSSIGIFEETEEHLFSNTQTSELLMDERPGSLRSIAILYGEPWLWRAYGELLYSVETGRQGFQHVHGKTLYEFLQQNQEAASIFNSAMTAFSNTEADAIIKAYNFSLKNVVVDVGGGEGFLLSALAKSYPNLSGVVLDLLVADYRQNSSRSDANITYVYGDFFKEIPAGGDVYILKSILHNWDDESCVTILRNCRKAMGEKASLLVIERIVPDGNGKSDAKLFDINMLIMTEGRERREDEYRNLFRAAGFMLTRVVPTNSSLSIVEGHPISHA
jgi:hypothetical protein